MSKCKHIWHYTFEPGDGSFSYHCAICNIVTSVEPPNFLTPDDQILNPKVDKKVVRVARDIWDDLKVGIPHTMQLASIERHIRRLIEEEDNGD